MLFPSTFPAFGALPSQATCSLSYSSSCSLFFLVWRFSLQLPPHWVPSLELLLSVDLSLIPEGYFLSYSSRGHPWREIHYVQMLAFPKVVLPKAFPVSPVFEPYIYLHYLLMSSFSFSWDKWDSPEGHLGSWSFMHIPQPSILVSKCLAISFVPTFCFSFIFIPCRMLIFEMYFQKKTTPQASLMRLSFLTSFNRGHTIYNISPQVSIDVWGGK